MSFRKTVFWLHLAAGLVAGLAIAVMCVTGVALAFEKQLTAWSERDARLVAAPAPGEARLSLEELTDAVRDAKPDARPSAIAFSADPRAAVAFSFGRDEVVYVNPYTGEVRRPASTGMHDFLHTMEEWHRWLALSGDRRPVGKAVNGACNLAFFVLAVTGLYLWLPRSWSWRSVRALAVFNVRLAGKARDFNWHNSVGLWSAPVLIVLTLTALPISYRWAGNLVYTLAGDTPPAQPGPAGMAGPAVVVPAPAAGARPLGRDVLFDRIRETHPHWREITLRLSAPGPRGAGPQAAARPAGASGETPRPAASAAPAGERRSGPAAATFVVAEPGVWPRTATTTVSLDPYTGATLRTEAFADLSPGRRLRTWTRFLHTGEALGWPGQLVAGLASLGGALLVYTGFLLSYRRFFGQRVRPPV